LFFKDLKIYFGNFLNVRKPSKFYFLGVSSTILKKGIATNKTPLSIVISFVGSWAYGHHKIENES
jgi:hypothetical protein